MKVKNLLSQKSHSDFNVTESYDASSSPLTALDYSYIFNTVAYNCEQVPTSCSLYESDCTATFSGSSTEVYMESTHPFNVKYFKNNQQGFSYDTCIKCWYDISTPGGTLL